MYSLPEIYRDALETLNPPDELIRDVCDNFAKLNAAQQMILVRNDVWNPILQSKHGELSGDVRRDLTDCFSALQMQRGDLKAN